MQEWVNKHGFTDNSAMLDYAYALSERYGSAIGALACQMYEATAAAQGVTVSPAEAAATPEYGEVAKAVNGAKKQSEKLVPSTVGRLVKQVGADTTLKNAQRDGAQFAWVPHGDSCAFCLMLASRGWQYMSKKALKNGHAEHIHANCDCQYAVRFDGKSTVEGYDPDEYREMYDNAEGSTTPEKLNAMRRAIAAIKRGKNSLQAASASGKMKVTSTATDIVEQSIGVKKGTPADIATSVANANPNYANGYEYTVNCQRCVQAYELQRRGYDVSAVGMPTSNNTIKWGAECFTPGGTHSEASALFTFHQTAGAVKREIANAPDGARYAIYVQWKKKRNQKNVIAHVFIAEKTNGKVQFVDPQSGKTDASDHFSRGSEGKFGYCRLDDKQITTNGSAISATVKKR